MSQSFRNVTLSSANARDEVVHGVASGFAEALDTLTTLPMFGLPNEMEMLLGVFEGLGMYFFSTFAMGLMGEIGRELTDAEKTRIKDLVRKAHDEGFAAYVEHVNQMNLGLSAIFAELIPGGGKAGPEAIDPTRN